MLNTELQLDRMKQSMARRTLLLDSNQPYTYFQLSVERNSADVCRNFTAYLLVCFNLFSYFSQYWCAGTETCGWEARVLWPSRSRTLNTLSAVESTMTIFTHELDFASIKYKPILFCAPNYTTWLSCDFLAVIKLSHLSFFCYLKCKLLQFFSVSNILSILFLFSLSLRTSWVQSSSQWTTAWLTPRMQCYMDKM